MPRCTSILLGLILAITAGRVSALHIHAYTDHDHPEHHHGLAAHEHHRPAPHHEADGPTVESCDPGEHALSITMGCARQPHAPAISAECGATDVVAPLIPVRSVRPVTDVRVHGPPPRTDAPPRAPPLLSPA